MANRRYEKYYALTKGNTNAVNVTVYYHLGGYNMFTYEPIKRGYYISITPCNKVKRDGYSTIETAAFSGYKTLIKELKRDSQKAFDEAVKYAEENAKQLFKTWFPDLETEWKEI